MRREFKGISPRRFFGIFFGVAFGVLALVGLLNILIDPRGILGLNRLGIFLAEDREYKPTQVGIYSHDALLLGNSLVGGTDPDEFPTPYTFFNVSLAGATPEELRCFTERYIPKAKLVVIGLSFEMFRTESLQDFNRPLPDSFRERIFNPIFNLRTLEFSVATIFRWLGKENPKYKQNGVSYSGVIGYLQQDRVMTARQDAALLAKETEYYKSFVYSEPRLAELRRLKEILIQRRIPFIVFINPVSRPVLDILKSSPSYPLYLRWQRDMREIFPGIVDFSEGKFSDLEYYYKFDAGHYKPEVGHEIMKTLLREYDPNQ